MLIVCEPIVSGYVHASVNAALIVTLLKAFPNEQVLFLAEANHYTEVAALTKKHYPAGLTRLQHRKFPLFADQEGSARDIPFACWYLRTVNNLAAQFSVKHILFCSTPMVLLFTANYLSNKTYQYRFILHSILEKIVDQVSLRRFWRKFFTIKYLLERPVLKQLRYIVLAQYVKEALEPIVPGVISQVDAINLPAFISPGNIQYIPTPNRIIFTMPGVVTMGKNSHLFFALAKQVQELNQGQKAQAIFRQIGKVTDPEINNYVNKYVETIGGLNGVDKPEYDRLVAESDFIVLLYPASKYRFSASAVFYDILTAGRPIIALRSKAFDHYFKLCGDLGYLYDSFEELGEGVASLVAKGMDKNVYEGFLNNLAKARVMFDHQAQVDKIQKIFL